MMPTLSEAAALYAQLDLSPETIRFYNSRVSKMADHLGGDRPLESVTPADVLDYVSSLRHQLKPSTYFQYRIAIKTFWKWCVEMTFISVSPAAAIKVRKPNREPEM